MDIPQEAHSAVVKVFLGSLREANSMTHDQQAALNQQVIDRLAQILANSSRMPSYKAAVATINAEGYHTSRGLPWTSHRLFRMLQRQGISGLWGLKQRQR